MVGAPGSLWVRGGATKFELKAPEAPAAGQARSRGHWGPRARWGMAEASRVTPAGQQVRREPKAAVEWRWGAQGHGASQGPASAKPGRTLGRACRDLGKGEGGQLVPRLPG